MLRSRMTMFSVPFAGPFSPTEPSSWPAVQVAARVAAATELPVALDAATTDLALRDGARA